MKVISTPAEFIELRKSLKDSSIGFVPTMGSLHRGHMALVNKARSENNTCVVSIYLNETQFNDPQDLKSYPVSWDQDVEKLAKAEVDYLFAPNFESMYPDRYRYQVHEVKESLELCGKDRPGHFSGVLTVVLKLLNIVKPEKAYFGEKDFQQLQLIKGLVESFFLDTTIVSVATQRNDKGLALSSRNKKLSPQDLDKAEFFAQALQSGKSVGELQECFTKKGIEVDYLTEKEGRRFAAVKVSDVRLIDNVEI